ncbi:ATP-binding cassette domain-containing protein [Bengtsoniella intestinalis]|uniref:ATP-binding cassette domain-containing protein n=1 Tax=Bengtsoniella intestinalis TaxID=3073143 RepID=UPI00391F4CEC
MKQTTMQQLLTQYPYVEDFFAGLEVPVLTTEQTVENYLFSHKEFLMEEKSTTPAIVLQDLEDYIQAMELFLHEEDGVSLSSLTIVAGVDKAGNPESFETITLYPSQVIAIVGPTGSGKSRLLADIEWTANGDTQTKRKIYINGKTPDLTWRYSVTNQLVAQLSQNMNFVIDATVYEFLELHAQCRNVAQPQALIAQIIQQANALSGEKFHPETNVTALSGGQSRALMIADTAILSPSPIVLIDEIENAGIDRKKALDLLLSQEKIVLMATHDPILCLMADKRLVIKNGGILDVIETSSQEKDLQAKLWEMDGIITDVRTRLRAGERLEK